jgi:hypothetical protein
VSEQAVAAVTPPTSSAQLRMLRGDSTRYLCAGVYLDTEFRDAALEELLGRSDRAVAPAFTTDAVPVVRHALNARHRQVVRDAVLTGVLVLLLIVEGRNLLALVALYVAWRLILRALRALAGLRMVAFLAQVLFALLAVLVAALLFQSGSELLSSLTGSGDFESGFSVKVFAVLAAGVFLLLVGLGWVAIVLERLVNRQTILEHLNLKSFVPGNAPPEPPAQQARIGYLAEAQTGNVTYYASSVADRPLIGAGTPGEPWTLSVPLVPVGDASEKLGLTTESLEDAISLALARLDESANEPIGDEVSVQRRLVTPGTLRPGDQLLDPKSGLLRPRIPAAEMRGLAEAQATGTNEYLCVRMTPRRADYEIWAFLSCRRQGRMLHLELISSCVPPVRAAFREIDKYAELDNNLLLRTAFGALLELPGLLIRAPLRLLQAVGGHRARAGLRTTLAGLASASTSDRGARTSIRELAVDPEVVDFLGNLTTQRQIRLIERTVIETVAAALEQAGFSADEFNRRTQAVLDGPAR